MSPEPEDFDEVKLTGVTAGRFKIIEAWEQMTFEGNDYMLLPRPARI